MLRIFAVFALLACAAGSVPPAFAQSDDATAPTQLAPPDQLAIRHVVEAQLAAFQRDDGAAAFGFATPTLQQKFGDPATFMAMVKSGYPAVYRPRSLTFQSLVDTKLGPDQMLNVIGPDGLAYTAHYMMERQADGAWMVNGCYLTRNDNEGV